MMQRRLDLPYLQSDQIQLEGGGGIASTVVIRFLCFRTFSKILKMAKA